MVIYPLEQLTRLACRQTYSSEIIFVHIHAVNM